MVGLEESNAAYLMKEEAKNDKEEVTATYNNLPPAVRKSVQKKRDQKESVQMKRDQKKRDQIRDQIGTSIERKTNFAQCAQCRQDEEEEEDIAD